MCLAGGHLQDGQCVDLEVESDTIVAIRPALPRRPSPQLVDAHGYLLLPAPAEAHAHLDKVLTASLLANPTGDLDGAVSAWYEHRTRVDHEEIVQRAMRAARLMLSFGATAIRTHVDVGTATGLRFAHAMNDVRAQLRTELDLQVVGFVDVPTTGATGAANRKLLRDALAVGVDVIGGAPYRDPDPAGCQRTLFELAREFDRPIDLHTDELLDASSESLTQLAALATSLRGVPVAASHCVSLSLQQPPVIERVAASLRQAEVTVVCCPATNLYLQGRRSGTSSRRGLAPVRQLLDAGVAVAAGGDNFQDPFNPLGRGDPLDTAALAVHAGHLTLHEAYAAISSVTRRLMGLPNCLLRVGDQADILAIRATDLNEALAVRPDDRIVVHRGRVVSQSPSRPVAPREG